MKLSRVRTIESVFLGTAFAVFGLGVASAMALDAPQSTVHHSRLASRLNSRFRETHHAVAHGAASKASATHTDAAHASTTHAAVAHSATLRATPKSTPTMHATAGTARGHLRRAAYRRHRYYERFTASSFVHGEIGAGDVTTGEDPVVRQAAIDALGDMNGTAVVIDPSNGRILAMVNQKLALSPGAEPCSTIKLTVAMAALSEGLVTRETPVQLSGFRMNMTQALAKSNNLYFEELGRELGFERVHHYATEFGLGELAGYNIRRRATGRLSRSADPRRPRAAWPACAASARASRLRRCNWAPLWPPSPTAERSTICSIRPRPKRSPRSSRSVKRTLDIARFVPDLEDGMAGAVEYGTARRLRANFRELPVFGKTGTCSDNGTRFGWFASYSDSPQGSLVTVFFLEGGRPTFGPRAAELTGEFYRNLWDHDYFAEKDQEAGNAPASAPATAPAAAYRAPAAPVPAEQ